MNSLCIVTPTLNCERTLGRTLASIKPLVLSGAKHVVVDSFSTDATVGMANSAGAEVVSFPKGNMYAAINEGLRKSGADWFTYINGDDILHADAITEMINEASGDDDVIYGNIDYIDEADRFLFSWRCPPEKWLRPFVSSFSPIPQQGTVFRKRVFDTLGGFNTEFQFSADYDFWVRALKAGCKFRKYKERSVAGFRLMPQQLSQSRQAEMAPEGVSIRKRLKAEHSAFYNMAICAWAAVYRNMTNIDSHFLRCTRGRGLDKR